MVMTRAQVSGQSCGHAPRMILSDETIFTPPRLFSVSLSLCLSASASNASESSACRFRLHTIEHLASLRHKQYTFGFSAFPLFEIDRVGIEITKVHLAAPFLGDPRRQSNFDARRLDAAIGIVRSDAFEVRT